MTHHSGGMAETWMRPVADEASGNGADPKGRSDWERFEAFAERLVGVPKAEVDALRKREATRRRSKRPSATR